MGRKLYRVPLDFDWPLHKPWRGFQNPHHRPCPLVEKNLCLGGASPAGRWLAALSNLIALMGSSAVSSNENPTNHLGVHPYLDEWPQAPRAPGTAGDPFVRTPVVALTEELAGFVRQLAPEQRRGLYGTFDAFDVEASLRKLTHLAPEWGVCPVCKGESVHPDAAAAAEAWQEEPPPTGDGYQVWETVSEGSPISPVFRTREALALHLRKRGYTQKAIDLFIDSGWAPTGTIEEGVFQADIQAHDPLRPGLVRPAKP